MMPNSNPLYLLADSSLLFKRNENKSYPLQPIINSISKLSKPKAVYIGASNGDQKEFYEIFESAMTLFGFKETTHIKASFDVEEEKALKNADLILLAGGDPEMGWNVMEEKKMTEIIQSKYTEGTILIGVSAGAIHLSKTYFTENGKIQPMLGLCPFMIGAHDEANNWERLQKNLVASNETTGLGIAFGSAIVYTPNERLQVLGKESIMYKNNGAALEEIKLLPGYFTLDI